MRLARRFSDIAISSLTALPDIIAYLGTVFLIVDQGISSWLDRQSLISTPGRISILALVVASLSVGLQRRLAPLTTLSREIGILRGGIEELIPSDQSIDIKSLITKSKTIRILSLAGTKLASLGSQEIVTLLADGTRRVILLLGDPYSDAIIARYARDEPETFESGVEGIQRRLESFLALKRQLPANVQHRFEVKVFSSYPTCSIVQGDSDMYAIVYGYKLRGSDCPKVHTREHAGPFAEFLGKHFDKVYADAVPIEQWGTLHGH